MKIILYFPPLVIHSILTPYSSVPILSAYLKNFTNHNIICKDINVDLINRLINLSKNKGVEFKNIPLNNPSKTKRTFFQRVKNKVYRKLFWNKNTFDDNKGHISLEEAEYLTIEGLKIILKDLSIDFTTYEKLQGNDSQIVFPHYLFDYWNLTYNQLNNIIEEDEIDPIFTFLGSRYFNEITIDKKIMIGISVAFFTQFGAAISLSKYIKKINPKAFIIIGGPAIRRISRNLKNITKIFDIIDCFVETEGEDILVELSNRIDKDEVWNNTPGIIYRDSNDKVIKNPSKPFNINKDSVPDYSLIYKHDYLKPYNFYLRTSIGCYWNKCRFCTQSFGEYQQRKVETIVNDMIILAKKYDAKRIHFGDETIPFSKLSKIADLLIKKNASIFWTTSSRFDGEFTSSLCKKLIKSSADCLMFGLESASQRVNNLMNKGVEVKNAQRIINICRKYGLFCRIAAIIGFPGETEEEMLETVNFLKFNLYAKVYGYISIFSLNYGSYVYQNPKEFGITYIEDAKDFFYKENYYFKCKNQVPYEKMMEIRSRVRSRI